MRTSDGVELYVESEGDGTPVVLLHGFPDSIRTWDGVAPRLVAAGHRVIRWDQRGFGRSDAPVGPGRYGIDRIAADVAEVLASEGVTEPVGLVGHDWGAMISWRVASTQPELVRRHVALSVGHQRAYATAGIEQKLRSLYVLVFQFPGLAERILAARDFALFRRSLPEAGPVVADMSRPGRLTAGLNWYRANALRLAGSRWPKCPVPTLGVISDGDAYLTDDQMARSALYTTAGFELVRLRGVGHWLQIEQPEETAALIDRWCSDSVSGHGDGEPTRIVSRG